MYTHFSDCTHNYIYDYGFYYKTWDKFKGRDDGLERAEIDASQATVTPGVLMSQAKRNIETLLAYIQTGRLAWEQKLLEERRATEAIQEAIAALDTILGLSILIKLKILSKTANSYTQKQQKQQGAPTACLQ